MYRIPWTVDYGLIMLGIKKSSFLSIDLTEIYGIIQLQYQLTGKSV